MIAALLSSRGGDCHQVERPDVAPNGCIVFEDSMRGVKSGLRAGAKVVRIATTADELPGVELMVRDFTDPALESWLRSHVF